MNKILISSILVVILLSTSLTISFVNADTDKKPIASFVDIKKDPQSYVKRYQNEPTYKTWFDKNYGLKYKSIYEAVGLSEPTKKTTNTIQTNNHTKSKLPSWIKDKALLFGQGKISENEFLKSIQFLVDNGIVKSNSSMRNNTQQNTPPPTPIPTPPPTPIPIPPPTPVIEPVKLVDCNARGSGVDLHGCNFSGTQYGPKIYFESKDLSYANLSGADLKWTKFHATSLYHANLHGADFRYATFFNTNFDGADLSDANFVGANLGRTTFNGANINGANFDNADIVPHETDFTGCKGVPIGVHYELCNGIAFKFTR